MTTLTIFNGQIIMETVRLVEGWIVCEDGKIQATGQGEPPQSERMIDAQGGYVLPGFIDVHVHGADGHDTMDGSVAGLLAMGRFFAQHGVTSYLPTTLTDSSESTTLALQAIRDAMAQSYDGATILGAHLEGPYLHPDQSGAQNTAYIRLIDRDEFQNWLAIEVIRLVSVAPEQEDSEWLITECIERDITVSAAHTTADYETMQDAIALGVSHATHTYNAMPKLHHRQPGGMAALMLAPQVRCELIADTIHVHPAMIQFLHKMVGSDRLVLITDAMQATGKPEGTYHLGRYDVTVRDGEARLQNGTLAGSTLTLNRGLANLCKATGLSIPALWRTSSYNAAQAIGVSDRKGMLAMGYDADIVILDAESPETVLATVIGGAVVYEGIG